MDQTAILRREFLARLFLFLGFCFVASVVAPAGETRPFTFSKKTKGLHISGDEGTIQVEPAFEDYAHMLFQACDAFKLETKAGECMIYPLTTLNLRQGAIATIEDGNDVIIYDRTLSKRVGYYGAMGIIAHELGHHYCRHLYKAPSSLQELEADKFAGAALRLAGVSRSDALAMTAILSERPSSKHPAREERRKAIVEGWDAPAKARACR